MADDNTLSDSKFIDMIDKELRQSIKILDQKLKGLRAEVYAKLELYEDDDDERASLAKENLNLLAKDVEKSIANIHHILNMEISKEFTKEDFLAVNHEEIESLRETFHDSTSIISKLKERF